MTTSASTTFSPSSFSTTRSTPCVAGCCGPMLMTSSSVSNIGRATSGSIYSISASLNDWRSFSHCCGLSSISSPGPSSG